MFPGSSDTFYIVSYYLKWVTTSWTYSSLWVPCFLCVRVGDDPQDVPEEDAEDGHQGSHGHRAQYPHSDEQPLGPGHSVSVWERGRVRYNDFDTTRKRRV